MTTIVPLNGQSVTLAKSFNKGDTTFQTVGRLVKTSTDSGIIGPQFLAVSPHSSSYEAVYINQTAEPTLITDRSSQGKENIYEYTVIARGIESDNSAAPPTLTSTDNEQDHQAGAEVSIVVSSEHWQILKNAFDAGSTSNTVVAGENITILNSVSLHTDGKLYKYHKTNYPSLVGVATETVSSGSNIKYTTFNGLSTGHTGLTMGGNQYADNTGVITETSGADTTLLGVAETATSIRIVKVGDPVTELTQAQVEDSASTAFGSVNGQRLDQFIVDSTRVVHSTTDESIAGVKTFADDSARSTTNAAPSNDLSFANKKYVDDSVPATADLTKVQAITVSFNPAGSTGAKTTVVSHSLGRIPKFLLVDGLSHTTGYSSTPINSPITFVAMPGYIFSGGGLEYWSTSGWSKIITSVSFTSTQITINWTANYTTAVGNYAILAVA